MQSSAGGCREQRAGAGRERPARVRGTADPAAPLPARAGSARGSVPASALPGGRLQGTATGSSFFPPTCALHSLTAPEPMEMHQKLLSNELILVQSCHQSFCCSACHSLSCLVQPCPSPSLPPHSCPASIPTASPGGCRCPRGPQPGDVSQDTSAGCKSLQQCRAGSTGVGVACTLCIAGSAGFRWVPRAVASSPAPEPCGCSPGGNKRRDPLPGAHGSGGWYWFWRDPSWVRHCHLHSFPAAQGLCQHFCSPGLLWLLKGAVTPPGTWRGPSVK